MGRTRALVILASETPVRHSRELPAYAAIATRFAGRKPLISDINVFRDFWSYRLQE
jgi:hypothetical protein